MILVDFSQVAIANCYAFESDFRKGRDSDKMRDIIRHSFITTALNLKKAHGKKYGELVFACDGSRSWRKDAYKYYKASRAKSRADSNMDWSAIFDHINTLQDELTQFFPWRVIKIDGAEGDDIIGVLTKYVTENHTKADGLFEVVEPVLIISSDKDFFQLHTIQSVAQYSPIQKKFVGDSSPDYLIEKIIGGDAGDSVPSVLCPDDWFVNEQYNGVRAKPVTKAVKDRFKKGIGLTEAEMHNFERNKQMISFECIPERISTAIVEKYKSLSPNYDLEKTLNFLLSVRAKQLVDRIKEFSNK